MNSHPVCPARDKEVAPGDIVEVAEEREVEKLGRTVNAGSRANLCLLMTPYRLVRYYCTTQDELGPLHILLIMLVDFLKCKILTHCTFLIR